ncbi:tail fiber protein [Flavitalea flava]
MRTFFTHTIFLLILLTGYQLAQCQQSIGIGTTTPDSKAALDITSTQKGVLLPRLTPAQITTLTGILTPAEMGMMVVDATTGNLVTWSGSSFQAPSTGTAFTAKTPLSVTSNKVSLNPGTQAGDLITWDGTNWVNAQPAPLHFSHTIDNRQPYLALNYCISLFGIFPSQNDAAQPYVGEIFLLGCNFAPVGWAFCDGQLLAISDNQVLFQLIGTTYGGDGQNTFGIPDLRGRLPIHQGNNGSSNYIIGQASGTEQKIFAH